MMDSTSLRSRIAAGVAAAAALALGAGQARSAPVEAASAAVTLDLAGLGASSVSASDADAPLLRSTLYDGNTLYTGVSFTRFAIDVPGAGQVEVRLQDLDFPELAGALSFAIVDGGTVLGVLDGPGSFLLDVDGPRSLFAYAYAVGAPGVSAGSFHVNVDHLTPVPLPAAAWLLLAGLGLAGWSGRTRRAAAQLGAA